VMTPTVNGFPWLAKQVGNNLVQQGPGTSYTLQGTDVPVLAFHLNIPARKVNVQVENADGSFVQPVFNYAAKLEYLRRNSSPTAFFTFSWDGTRGQDNGNNKRKVVPNGRYMLKLSVLKPLGDESNPADWEIFTTPVFTLARP
jgi:minor extracellular serine protease Vpr